MKKRKAKRIESTVDIELEIDKLVSNSEKMKSEAVLNLIAKMITDMILRELNEDKDPLNDDY
ncbi:hypothetical protein TH53_12990 [Pedobacter lusitanus]|uniref:Contig54, whole genome shotgun sequence n=1 Tax=Pedobacter lusitanus TaxID=1503925 RepID=A0A0D0GHV5_9SPHI|nr:hypothetical protein [Pedobacter lusitanus]KIO76827.1 hypothetical protein TH53_12990 [Pedobacter lusitanus]